MTTVVVSGSVVLSSSTSDNYVVDDGNSLEVGSGVTVSGIIEVFSSPPSQFTLTIDAGAVVNTCLIDGSGQALVLGTVYESTLHSFLAVYGNAFNTTVSAHGIEYVAGGNSTDAQIDSGGISEIWYGGTSYGALVNYGGSLNVHDGTATGASLASGATMVVNDGQLGAGLAKFTQVAAGATESASTTGQIQFSNVHGVESILSGGVGYGDSILSDGVLNVDSGGVVSNESIYGHAQISGSASFDTILAGGVEFIASGGFVANEVVYGTLDLLNGGNATGSITLELGGKLVIESSTVNPSTFGAEIAGFGPGDTIDLAAISYSAGMHVVRGATQNGQTTYYVENSTNSAVATLQMTPNLVSDNFVFKDDGTGHLDLIGAVAPDPVHQTHANDLTYASTASGTNHFIDLQNFEASYPDLIQAFGTNTQTMQNWYNTTTEHRAETFDGLDYIASYGDLISAFQAGSMQQIEHAGALHYISFGLNEGRTTTFNGLDYIASYSDLIQAYGWNSDAGAFHFIERGYQEGRTTTFDGLNYIASYSDLIRGFGANEQAGAAHFIGYGHAEGRTTTFDGLAYLAQYTDLMNDFGANNDAGAYHYIVYGSNEGRSGAGFNVAAYEQAHPDLIGKFATSDAFLTAYINTYHDTGSFLV
ncbi:hypothetical protein [Bradyrhizobium sp. 33ap4]|uniref:hypothetical protein n=1 Tax=Bradyrhizobium sp. 33ap4 TaxID=3061630 RepID=UPI00292D6905|nr:hypothetical protein [Bradyrhizobium sp. 33ap4]